MGWGSLRIRGEVRCAIIRTLALLTILLGSQVGSQHRPAPSDTRLCPATVTTGNGHVRRRLARPDYGPSLHGMEGVMGSNPLSSTDRGIAGQRRSATRPGPRSRTSSSAALGAGCGRADRPEL